MADVWSAWGQIILIGWNRDEPRGSLADNAQVQALVPLTAPHRARGSASVARHVRPRTWPVSRLRVPLWLRGVSDAR